MAHTKIRLFIDQPLAPAQSVALSREQSHYLFGVMRASVGDTLSIFNGKDGEYRATIAKAHKREGLLKTDERTADQQNPPDLWLLFAPIKKTRTDFIVEKATELGAARIMPVQTEFTNSERIRRDRLQSHCVEAAEQCGGTYVPQVDELQKLVTLLNTWPSDRSLIYCDESLVGARETLANAQPGTPTAILIGPEGGFSESERTRLSNLPFVQRISLGPRILRADTAAVSALTLWQSTLGDW